MTCDHPTFFVAPAGAAANGTARSKRASFGEARAPEGDPGRVRTAVDPSWPLGTQIAAPASTNTREPAISGGRGEGLGSVREVQWAAVRWRDRSARRRAAARSKRTRWERAPARLKPRQRLALERESRIGACREPQHERGGWGGGWGGGGGGDGGGDNRCWRLPRLAGLAAAAAPLVG